MVPLINPLQLGTCLGAQNEKWLQCTTPNNTCSIKYFVETMKMTDLNMHAEIYICERLVYDKVIIGMNLM